MTGVRATPKYKPAANKIQRKTKGEHLEKRWGKREKKNVKKTCKTPGKAKREKREKREKT